jgi:hypothetical protein
VDGMPWPDISVFEGDKKKMWLLYRRISEIWCQMRSTPYPDMIPNRDRVVHDYRGLRGCLGLPASGHSDLC